MTSQQHDKLATENNDIFRIIIKFKRIKTFHLLVTVSNLIRIFEYQNVS